MDPANKLSLPCLDLLKHIHKTLTKRPDFVERLPPVFVPSLEVAPAQNPAGWDTGLLQAADALMELAFAVYAEANPNPVTKDNRTKELETLTARLYVEKRVKDEAQKNFKKVLEAQIRKHFNEIRLLEEQNQQLVERLNKIQEDYELLQKETEEQAHAILAVSISSEGEPIARDLGESISQDLSQEIMTDSTTEQGLLLDSNLQAEAHPPPSHLFSSITTISHTPSPAESLSTSIPPPELPSSVFPSPSPSSEVQAPPSGGTLASTLPLSQLMKVPLEPLQQQVDDLEKSLVISNDQVSKAMVLMDKIEMVNSKIHENVSEVTQFLKGFESRLFDRLEELEKRLQQATSPVSELKETLGENHVSVTGALGQIIADLNRLNSKLEKAEEKQVPAELEKAQPKVPEEVSQVFLSFSKFKEKKRGQMKHIAGRLEEIETLLQLESPSSESKKFKKIDLRLRAILAELKQRSLNPPPAQKISEEPSQVESEKNRELLASVQAAYSTILYLFKSIIKHGRIVQKVANISPQNVPSIINEKLQLPFNTSPLEVPALLEVLVQKTELFAPEVMIFLEDHLEVLWQSQQKRPSF